MRDLTDSFWIKVKAVLFVLLGMFAGALILNELPSARITVLLLITIWAFCRAYYFAFYVIEKYVDPGCRFSGLGSALIYLVRGRNRTPTRARASSMVEFSSMSLWNNAPQSDVPRAAPLLPRGLLVCLIACMLCGCGDDPSYVRIPYAGTNVMTQYDPTNYFKGSHVSESKMMASETATDIAEMIWFAARKQGPSKGTVRMHLTEQTPSLFRHPRYDTEFTLGDKRGQAVLAVDVISSPDTYLSLAKQLSELADLHPSSPSPDDGSGDMMMGRLLDGSSTTLEKESQRVSGVLENDMTRANAHEQAVFLLGMLMLKENAGRYSDTRLELSRAAAHLTLARLFRLEGLSPVGSFGEIMTLVVMKRQVEALSRLQALDLSAPAAAAWGHIIRMSITGDYRVLQEPSKASPMERMAWLRAYSKSVGTAEAWSRLGEKDLASTPDYTRVSRAAGYTVQLGHVLASTGMDTERRELSQLHREYFKTRLDVKRVAETLNAPPTRCISASGQVRVIGWGTWAIYLQRHLCAELEGQYDFYHGKLGMPETADEIAASMATQFSALRLQPFVLLHLRQQSSSRSNLLARGVEVVQKNPELTPDDCWTQITALHPELSAERGMARLFNGSRLATSSWLDHYPLPGSADVVWSGESEWVMLGNFIARGLLPELRKTAPYDLRLLGLEESHSGPETKSAEVLEARWGALRGYSVRAMKAVAEGERDHPEAYEALMLKAAALQPSSYWVLGHYFLKRDQRDHAMEYFERYVEKSEDRVAAVSEAGLLINYYLDKAQTEKARKLADEAGEVYSERGLVAKSWFHERLGELTESHAWLVKNEERYGETGALICFCQRQAANSIGTPMESVILDTLERLRPKHLKQVKLADCKGPPIDGVEFRLTTPITKLFGLGEGDVIVAVYGYQVHKVREYERLRDTQLRPDLDLIVWDGKTYREVKCDLADKDFEAPFSDYKAP